MPIFNITRGEEDGDEEVLGGEGDVADEGGSAEGGVRVMWRGRGEGRPLPPRAPRLPRHRICAPMQSPEHHCFFRCAVAPPFLSP